MNSFISNFKPEAKVVAAVLLALLVCELALRKMETSLSLDLKHIRSIPEIAAQLSKAEGTRILFLGNSLTRSSIVPEIFLAETQRRGLGEIAAKCVNPDGTHINEWYFAFKTHFAEPALLPDLLVIITGRAHLSDHPMDPSTRGAYYSSRQDLAEYLFREKHSIDERIEFILGRYSGAFANRRRIQPRLFTLMIPHYQSCVQRINEKRRPRATRKPSISAPTYWRLEQLLQLAKENSVPVVVATVPMFEPYGIDSKIKHLLKEYGMQFIDADKIEGIDSSRFPDAYHLDKIGAEKYSRVLATKLVDFLATNPQFQKKTNEL